MVAMFTPFVMILLFGTQTTQTGTLTFTKPASWTDRAAASSMRVAEFVVSKVPGDTEDGELIVYYFGGGGGSVDANLQRWAAQFQTTKDPVRTTSDLQNKVRDTMTPSLTVLGTLPIFCES